MMNVGPWILPSGSPLNSSRTVNSIRGGLCVGSGFWMGDSGGAGGNAGDCAAGGLYLMDAVKELSVDGLDDKGLAV
jgi:hypothetical protein